MSAKCGSFSAQHEVPAFVSHLAICSAKPGTLLPLLRLAISPRTSAHRLPHTHTHAHTNARSAERPLLPQALCSPPSTWTLRAPLHPPEGPLPSSSYKHSDFPEGPTGLFATTLRSLSHTLCSFFSVFSLLSLFCYSVSLRDHICFLSVA